MWNFKLATELKFGVDSTKELSNIACQYGKNAVVVTDKFLYSLDSIQNIINLIKPVAVFSDVKPNPTVKNVDDLTFLLHEKRADLIIAIGGGSPMDCAKAASCLAKTGDNTIRPYHSEGKAFDCKLIPIPLITIPTTAGTGAELTPIAVLDDEEKNIKRPMSTNLFYPKLAVIDAKLTLSLPIEITAITALDALSHAIEGYWSRNHQPICDMFAKEAGRIIFENLPKVFENLNNINARNELSYAALIAGIAFHLPKNAIIHACSFALSTKFHLSHGAACAFTMEQAILFNSLGMNGRMEEFASYCGFKTIEEMVNRITELKKIGNLPVTLQDANICEEDIADLVKDSFHPLMNNNPREITVEILEKLYRNLE